MDALVVAACVAIAIVPIVIVIIFKLMEDS